VFDQTLIRLAVKQIEWSNAIVQVFARTVRLEEAHRPDRDHWAMIVGVVMTGRELVRVKVFSIDCN